MPEMTAKHAGADGDLEAERDRLRREVEDLRLLEREYRSRLRSYFTGLLAELNEDFPDD